MDEWTEAEWIENWKLIEMNDESVWIELMEHTPQSRHTPSTHEIAPPNRSPNATTNDSTYDSI